MSQRKSLLINLLLFSFTLFACLSIAEIVLRKIDKQPINGELPFLYGYDDPKIQEKAHWLSMKLAGEHNALPEISALYPSNPTSRTYGHPREEIIENYKADGGKNVGDRNNVIMKVWNKDFIRDHYCRKNNWYPPDIIDGHSFLYAFEPYDSTCFPVYRYFPNSMNKNNTGYSKFRFTNFGWSGDSIPFLKPANTVRIAFLGASTTAQAGECDFAYPDYIGNWLNEWALRKGIDVRFEVINTGRVGLKSYDFHSIMRYELTPVEPDIVIYYEGKNQVHLDDITCDCGNGEVILYTWLRKFALLRKVADLVNYNILEDIESLKPDNILKFPYRVDINNPDITSPFLPLSLDQIVTDLDSIKSLNEKINSSLIVCSYAMLTDERVLTEGLKYGSVYSYWINQFGSIRLNDIALLNGFENRVFKTYCEKNNLKFIDVAKDLPRLPEAFIDGIHLNCEGMKYHAWIVFLNLLPMIEEKINAGVLPRKATQTLTSHPYIKENEVFEKIYLPYNCN